MPQNITRWQKFKRFLKRNMTPLWAKRFSYQVFSLLVSIAMIVGVASYAFTKSYDERELVFVEDFTICAHTGSFGTADNSIESIEKAIEAGADSVEFDIRKRPDGTVVMGHDIITTNNDGVEVSTAFDIIKNSKVTVNLDIKDIKALPELYKLIEKYNLKSRVYLTGIESYQAKNVKQACPDIDYYINYIPSRFKIFSEDYQQKLLNMIEETGAIGINCNHRYASKTLSNLLHNNGYKLSVWTVNKKYEIKRALVNEPDNITTKEFYLVKDIIKNWGNN